MTRLKNPLMAIALSLVTVVPAFADHGARGDLIDERLQRQQQRIKHGIYNRELTRKEARVLKKQQRWIRHLALDFREDGHLSRKERRILHHNLNRASNQIWTFKHNEWTRRDRHHQHDQFAWNDTDNRHRFGNPM